MRSLGRIFLIAVLSAVLGGCVGSYGNGRYNLYDGYNAYGRPNNIANWGQPPVHSHCEANYGGGLSSSTCWNCGRN